MTRKLKIHWLFWSLLVALVAAGAQMSTAEFVTVNLRPQATVSVSVFRPLPHQLGLALSFRRRAWQLRPELGVYAAGQKAGFIEFLQPGVPIKLLVSSEGKAVAYEALPVTSHSETVATRRLLPYTDDGDPKRFQWPSKGGIALSSGWSTLSITVLEVGQPLVGEQVTLAIHSPINLRSMASGYGLFYWLVFWPWYALFLVGYGAALLWKCR
ncbi:hypothetical protein KFZ76_20130 [Methylovulum psychrotolerans]|uniref:hypothetical protein n=1 Tax=Methylovulum psychrotolerans TaxID=1704499 RepID=UPI001BFF683B|nr:hypothetical protein [Methylovulum psychrotolerans]MBT9100013.1 hypothetical protein [Methylovulum psychrotolerans]